MVTMCACGKYIYSSSANPWSICTLDMQGRVIEGVCVHGMHFPFQEDNSMNIRGEYNEKTQTNKT